MKTFKKIAEIDEKGKLLWVSWKEIPTIRNIRIQYGLHSKNRDRFEIKDSILYLVEADTKRLQKSLAAALKISGSVYVLVLMLTEGKKGREFNAHHANISSKLFKKRGIEYIRLFEGVVKEYGVLSGTARASGAVSWERPLYDESYLTTDRLRVIYRTNPQRFYTIDDKVYYLAPAQIAIEQMFWKCVELEGGENELAQYIANASGGVSKDKQRHLMNFRRLGFKHNKTFYEYAKVFSDYLQKNVSLFDMREMQK